MGVTPTMLESKYTAAAATTTMTWGGATGADSALFVLCAMGTQATIGSTIDSNSVTDSTWTLDAVKNGSGTNRACIWSKIVPQSEVTKVFGNVPLFNGTYGPTSWGGAGSRMCMYAFTHPDGFSTASSTDPNTRVLGKVEHATNTGAASGTLMSVSGGVRPLVAVFAGMGTSSGMTLTWDSDAAATPQIDNSLTSLATAQSGYKVYGTAETVDLVVSSGMNNTTHAYCGVVYQVQPPTIHNVNVRHRVAVIGSSTR